MERSRLQEWKLVLPPFDRDSYFYIYNISWKEQMHCTSLSMLQTVCPQMQYLYCSPNTTICMYYYLQPDNCGVSFNTCLPFPNAMLQQQEQMLTWFVHCKNELATTWQLRMQIKHDVFTITKYLTSLLLNYLCCQYMLVLCIKLCLLDRTIKYF